MICDMANNIDRIAFWQDVRRGLLPALSCTCFVGGMIVYFLNTPVSLEKIQGTVIRNFITPDYKSGAAVISYVELDGGRVVTVSIPNEVKPPHEGDRILIMRYVKRFFGDSFGLAN